MNNQTDRLITMSLALYWLIQLILNHKHMAFNNKKAPHFLIKTYNILDNPVYHHIVHWNEDNSGFVIADPQSFAFNVLPHYFKHNNMHSYIRQLNMYGFSKQRGKSDSFYFHEYFNKAHPELISQIQRKIENKPSKQSRNSSASINDEVGHQSHLSLLKINQLFLIQQITNLELVLQETVDAKLRAILESSIERYIRSQNDVLMRIIGSKKQELIETTELINISQIKIL